MRNEIKIGLIASALFFTTSTGKAEDHITAPARTPDGVESCLQNAVLHFLQKQQQDQIVVLRAIKDRVRADLVAVQDYSDGLPDGDHAQKAKAERTLGQLKGNLETLSGFVPDQRITFKSADVEVHYWNAPGGTGPGFDASYNAAGKLSKAATIMFKKGDLFVLTPISAFGFGALMNVNTITATIGFPLEPGNKLPAIKPSGEMSYLTTKEIDPDVPTNGVPTVGTRLIYNVGEAKPPAGKDPQVNAVGKSDDGPDLDGGIYTLNGRFRGCVIFQPS